MLWLIIGAILAGLGIYLLITDGGCGEEGPLVWLILIGFAIIGVWFYLYVGWNQEKAEIIFASVIIQNKIDKIHAMQKTYYCPPKNTQLNIDMVNKDLATNINKEIKDLETTVNEYNNRIIKWQVRYRYRFFGACFVNPRGVKLLKLSNYKF